jgi:hypothetical protein
MLIECTRPRGDLERAREALRAARYGQPLGERL